MKEKVGGFDGFAKREFQYGSVRSETVRELTALTHCTVRESTFSVWKSQIRELASSLACHRSRPHALGMFVVSEAEAAAIRAAFEQSGELAAAIELRRLFPGITDNARARECARTIVGWQSSPLPPKKLRTRRKPQPAD